MNHPADARLALYAGGEIGVWARWRVERHLAGCAQCRRQVGSFQSDRDRLREACADLPQGLDFDRLASEMGANIRVGLAAGECVGPVGPRVLRPRWHRAVILAPVLLPVLAVLIFVLQWKRPHPQAELVPWVEGTVIAATSEGIELKQGDRILTLRPPNVGDATYLVSTQGTVRADYVDEETGQVTIHSVYAQ